MPPSDRTVSGLQRLHDWTPLREVGQSNVVQGWDRCPSALLISHLNLRETLPRLSTHLEPDVQVSRRLPWRPRVGFRRPLSSLHVSRRPAKWTPLLRQLLRLGSAAGVCVQSRLQRYKPKSNQIKNIFTCNRHLW